ncbi:MAG TPA: cupredoxin domain-containing protein [Bacteroidia bacterium]|nr:cupredoxin domain-containing protein [Bacteroidia bacterium]
MKSKKKYSSEILFVSMLVLSLVMIMNGCKKDEDKPAPSPSQPANEVWMQNTAFGPSTITVSVNTTVVWKNKDSMTHTVTSNSGAFDSGNITGGGTYSRQFTTAGTFAYHCTIHSGMTGQVVVQ